MVLVAGVAAVSMSAAVAVAVAFTDADADGDGVVADVVVVAASVPSFVHLLLLITAVAL